MVKQWTMKVHQLRDRIVAMGAWDNDVVMRFEGGETLPITVADHDETIACYLGTSDRRPLTGKEFCQRLWLFPNLPVYFCRPQAKAQMRTIRYAVYTDEVVALDGEDLQLGGV